VIALFKVALGDSEHLVEGERIDIPAGYSYPATVIWFVLGAAVTAVFSGSLAVPAVNATWIEVLAVGMVVPSFTWLVQLSGSGLLLGRSQRGLYWGDLGRVCLIGSVALLPAAAVNLLVSSPPLWVSAANVPVSVAIMAVDLFRRSARHGISLVWPISWCLTIILNMSLFLWASRHWWNSA
jgi:hypothetical protein